MKVLATICLFPVDIALVSTTVDTTAGLRKPWASPERVAGIVFSLKVVYYSTVPLTKEALMVVLYGVDALFCLLIIPFSYFWYEEWDEESTLGSRVRGALKYSILFLVITVALLLTGFFIPMSNDLTGHVDLDYLKHLLSENRTLFSWQG
jgi:LMBR1 domain-containing protein 1